MRKTPMKLTVRRWVAAGTAASLALTLSGCTTSSPAAAPARTSSPAALTGAAQQPGTTATVGSATSTKAEAGLGAASGTGSVASAAAGRSMAVGATIDCDHYIPTRTGLRAGVGSEEESLAGALFDKLLENSLHFGQTEGLGWVLSLVTGEKGDKSQTSEIQRQIQDANTSIKDLKGQVTQLDNDLQADYLKLQNAIDYDTFSGSIKPLEKPIADIRQTQTDYDLLLSKAKTNLDYQFDTSDEADLAKWRTNLKADITAMLQGLDGDQPGEKSPIALYDTLIWSSLPGFSAATDKRILPGTYLNPAYNQVDYYSTLLAQAANLLSEVYHVSWPGYPSQPDTVYTYTKCASVLAAEMSLEAAHGVGRVPVDTVVDDRNPDAPRLWTNSPVSLDGDPQHTDMVNGNPSITASDQSYCTAPSRYCLVSQYDPQGNPATTTLARPTPGPLTTLIAAQHPLGYADWRIPTTADWNSLQQGSTGGLAAWAAHQNLNPFRPTTLTSYYGGKNPTLTVIPPRWVNTATTDAAPHYELLSSADPKADSLTLHPVTPEPVNATGGRLFLVRDLPASDQPLTAPTKRKQTAATPAGRATLVAPATATSLTTPTACSAAATYQVPAGVYAVDVTATGGAGAAGLENNAPSAKGGTGATVTTRIPVTPGSKLYYQVGGAGNGVTGGIGGAGNGGSSHLILLGSGDQSGGGGGSTGLSSTPDCSTWLVMAGGGGGGGAGVTQSALKTHDVGGAGGNGSTTVGVPTPGANGQEDAFHAGSAGHGSPGTDGGAPGQAQISNKLTKATAGGSGHGTIAGTGGNTLADYYGGGGGGGGGGYNSGGAGGAGLYGPGGGGAGGASFAMTALGVTPTFGHGDAGTAGSLTITPTASHITIQSSTTGWVLNIPGSQTADGTTLIQYPRENSANAQWQFRPADATANAGQLINPATNKCATVTTYGTVALSTCGNIDTATQKWTISDNPDATVTLTTAAAPASRVLTISPAGPTSLIVYSDNSRPGQHWTLNSTDWPDD